MRKVVVNTTPILILGHIGKLDILRELYGTIYITDAVFREITVTNDAPSAALLSSKEWIHVMSIENPKDYAMFRAKLHAGEVETMILAMQKDFCADLVILDDLAARKTAKFLGLTVTGTMGVLLKAKQEGLIQEIKPLLDEIIANGFYISDKMIRMILDNAGE